MTIHHTSTEAPRRLEHDPRPTIADGLEEYRERQQRALRPQAIADELLAHHRATLESRAPKSIGRIEVVL